MFAKLKKKIQDESGLHLDITEKSGPTTGPGLASPMVLKDGGDGSAVSSPNKKSQKFLTVISAEELGNTTKEEILTMLMRRTDQCRKLEATNAEYSTLLKEKNKNMEKMELALSKQQDAMSSRVRELSDQAEQSHANFLERIKSKNQEISDLRHSMETLENDRHTFEQNVKEIEILKAQLTEAAGHLTNHQTDITSLTTQLEDCKERCQRLTDENSRLSATSEDLSQDRDLHKKESVERCEEIFQLSQDRASEQSRRESLEQDLKLANRVIEEKEACLTESQERLKTLEMRLQVSTLSGSEREQALEKERNELETKVHDMETQLTNERSSTYEKITLLERQVADGLSSLNEIQATNRDLMKQREVSHRTEKDLYQQLTQLELSHQEAESKQQNTISSLNSQLLNATSENSSLSEQLHSFNKMTLECERLTTELHLLRATKDQLDKEVTDLKEQLDKMVTLDQQSQLLMRSRGEEMRITSRERDELLLRNADLSQQLMAAQQQTRSLNQQLDAKSSALVALEDTVTELQQSRDVEEQLEMREAINSEISALKLSNSQLEEQANERNKTIKTLQQRLADVKKALQRELRVQTLPTDDPQDEPSIPRAFSTNQLSSFDKHSATSSYSPFSSHPLAAVSPLVQVPSKVTAAPATSSALKGGVRHSELRVLDLNEDINFKYFKHVIIKFILSQESEALKLVAAVSALLRLNRDEQQLVKETLEWKMSWFGQKPDQGHMQAAKAVYPAY